MSYQFQTDISVETNKICCTILARNAPEEKRSNGRFWPLFKEWLADSISPYVMEYNFADLMNMVAVENPQPNIGNVLEYGINLYFDKKITSAFKYMEGCIRFATMNQELSGLTGYGEVIMFKEFIKNIGSYSWEKLIDEILIFSYFHPCFAEFAGVICCCKIPESKLSNFLRIANCYADTDRRTKFHSATAINIRRAIETFLMENGKNSEDDNTEEAFVVEKPKENQKGKQHKAKGKYRKKKIVTCSKCNKKGHSAKDCWSAEANCIIEDNGNYNFEEINIIEERCPVNKNKAEFILDSGATVHVVGNLNLLENVKKTKTILKTVNGCSSSNYSGDLKLNKNLVLKDVVYIESAPRNIISATRLTNQNGVSISMRQTDCKIYKNDNFIASGFKKNGLYILNNTRKFAGVYHMEKIDDVKQWHISRGHASINQMKREFNKAGHSKVNDKVFHTVLKNCISCNGRQC